MKTIKLFSAVILSVFFLAGCSKISDFFSSMKETVSDTQETTGSERTGVTSDADRIFYNKYVEVMNKISPSVDEVQKFYLSNVPEPAKVSRNSMIYVISADVYLNILARNHKELSRSIFEGGELSKLGADNEEMKTETEEKFGDVLKSVEDYIRDAGTVLDYYKNNEYKNDLSNVKPYDDIMKSRYKTYKQKLSAFTECLDRYKPPRIRRNPDDYSNPDEKAVAVLQNVLEETIDEAEIIYQQLENYGMKSDPAPIRKKLADFEENFEIRKKEVLSAPFTEKSNYIKFSFEDYFSKTASEFVKYTDKFLKNSPSMKEKDFDREYDYTVNHYNYLVQAYNTTINTAGSFRVY